MSKMRDMSDSGIFVKHFGAEHKVAMKTYAHRDDYYLFVLLTKGTAAIDIDFERTELSAGDVLIGLPDQVHRVPAGENFQVDGWLIALSPEFLSDEEVCLIEESAVSSAVVRPASDMARDINTLCSMLEKYGHDRRVFPALVSAIKSFMLSTLDTSADVTSGRYKTITMHLRKLLALFLPREKSPSVYASMLNISEVYLNEAVKCATGMSAGAYIRNRVIVLAKRQLAYTSLSAKEIACALGYYDYAYFSKLFKKYTGLSPSDYRKNLK